MILARVLDEAAEALRAAGIEECRTDAELLLREVLAMDRSQLFLQADRILTDREIARFNRLLGRRLTREPLHYILGRREFWSLDFHVGPGVLVPRPETEFVLEHILALIRNKGLPVQRILDMCTGTGVMAIVLANELACPVIGVDISSKALAYARANSTRHRVADRIFLIQGDLFAPIDADASFDLIVSNPPYIDADAIGELSPEVRDWEPRTALAAGCGGLDCIRRLVSEAWRYLHPGGLLAMEIGADQAAATRELLQEQERYEQILIAPDWAGRPRVATACRR